MKNLFYCADHALYTTKLFPLLRHSLPSSLPSSSSLSFSSFFFFLSEFLLESVGYIVIRLQLCNRESTKKVAIPRLDWCLRSYIMSAVIGALQSKRRISRFGSPELMRFYMLFFFFLTIILCNCLGGHLTGLPSLFDFFFARAANFFFIGNKKNFIKKRKYTSKKARKSKYKENIIPI